MVLVPGTVAGLLYTLRSPKFEPHYHPPLTYCAIGSGNGAISEIAATADWLLAGQPGNDLIERMALTEEVVPVVWTVFLLR